MFRVIALTVAIFASAGIAAAQATPEQLRERAHAFYGWRDRQNPVSSSDQGLHRWDDELTDYSAGAIAARAREISDLVAWVNAIDTSGWSKDDRIDWLLFRAQVEAMDFSARVLRPEFTDPQIYVNEAGNAIFSILKKNYDDPASRAISAMARLRAMPAMFEQAKKNLANPVRLYAELAIQSARAIDPLFQSIDTISVGLSSRQKKRLANSREGAIAAAHGFADWLESRLDTMPAWTPMGTEQYEFMLHHILLLPFDSRQVAELGEIELARYRALEAMLPDPSLADPDPKRAASIPADQEAFLAAYQSREDEMLRFLRERRLVTIPDFIGPFLIRQLPEAFKPTSPGGFMNPPGVYDQDNSGFYFIPTYDPASRNFYIRAAIEDPRPILGHEGIPGHFLQISIANHLKDEIRRQHADNVMVEGWALYGEEMLLREGLYPSDSAAAGQVLRLSRYRAARIGVDVNLHTGQWSFDEAVKYFQEAGGLDREAAEGEAAGAASSPTQKISYITGKWQIMRLLGKYRDLHGSAFRLGQFHDDLLAVGSLPLSIIEWILLDDPTALEKATGMSLSATAK